MACVPSQPSPPKESTISSTRITLVSMHFGAFRATGDSADFLAARIASIAVIAILACSSTQLVPIRPVALPASPFERLDLSSAQQALSSARASLATGVETPLGMPLDCSNSIVTASSSCSVSPRIVTVGTMALKPQPEAAISLHWVHDKTSVFPFARSAATITYDAADGYVLLFGGFSDSGLANDTWIFQSGKWTQIFPLNSPSPRSFVQMTYDYSDGYVVLFGGCGEKSGQVSVCPPVLGDTWIFKGGVWTNVTERTSPAARDLAVMTYDSEDHFVLLFGGQAPGVQFHDSWTFRAGNWTELNASVAGVPAVGDAATDDPGIGAILLLGGNYPASLVTWTFKGGVWTNITNAESPSNRDLASGLLGSALTFDTAAGVPIFFGGGGAGSTLFNDTWQFHDNGWQFLGSLTSPSPRWEMSGLAYDPTEGYSVLFGGISQAGSFLNETWLLYYNQTSTNQQSGAADWMVFLSIGVGLAVGVSCAIIVFVRRQSGGPMRPDS